MSANDFMLGFSTVAAIGGSLLAICRRPTPLTPAGLKHIQDHQYVGGAYTPLDNILNPFWFWCTELLPLWVAPNLVTLLGTSHLLFGYCLMGVYMPSYTAFEAAATPPWVYLCIAYCFFAYQTLDAMDGKQARRTGASSPLGQLFDHGCDALGTISQWSAAVAFLATGPTRISMAGALTLQMGFFFAQWQEYHTGVLRTSFGPVGVTEVMWVLIAFMVAAGVSDTTALLAQPIFLPAPLAALVNTTEMSIASVVLLGFVVFMLTMILISLSITLVQVAAEKKSVWGAMSQLVPVASVMIAAVLLPEDVLLLHFRAVSLSAGLLVVHLTNQMIVFSMANQAYPMLHASTVPMLVCTAAILALGSAWVCVCVYGTLAFNAVTYSLWVWAAIQQISEQLGIRCLSIAPVCKQA